MNARPSSEPTTARGLIPFEKYSITETLADHQQTPISNEEEKLHRLEKYEFIKDPSFTRDSTRSVTRRMTRIHNTSLYLGE